MKVTTTLLFTFITYTVFSQSLDIIPYATGLGNKISDIATAGDGRLFVASQTGRISVVDQTGTIFSTAFLDISDKVSVASNTDGSEQGLLGIAFSPNYKADGNFYIYYTDTTGIGNTVISRFHVSADSNVADAWTEQILFRQYQNAANHNGGCLKFGADGYLYCGLGDGGGSGDPENKAQNLDSLLGKMIRIDVSDSMYAIPPTNPFINNQNARPEIWAYGFRNPWRFSFDKLTHDLWIGDVGQDHWEEIDFQPAASTGGENYGWHCYEGNQPFDSALNCTTLSYTGPAYEYSHDSSACAIIGGYVYRGTQFADLYGKYIYTDYCRSLIHVLDSHYTEVMARDFNGKSFVTFGENNLGELYVADGLGTIYHVVLGPTGTNDLSKSVLTQNIYPNPNNGNFAYELQLEQGINASITVSDILGKTVYSADKNFVAGANTLVFNLNNAPGVYLLKLQSEGEVVSKEFLVE